MLLDVAADAVPAFPGACQNNRRCHRLRALDALRVAVRHLGGLLRQRKCFVQRGGDVSARGHAHRGAVPKAAVGAEIWRNQPVPEAPPVAAHRAGVLRRDLTHRGHGMALEAIVAFTCLHQRTCHCNAHQAVVGVAAPRCKQRKVHCLDAVKLVGRASDVADDRSNHEKRLPAFDELSLSKTGRLVVASKATNQ